MPDSAKAEKTPQELDEELLREIEAKTKEVLDLMVLRVNRTEADHSLQEARARRELHTGNKAEVYHPVGEGGTARVATTMHTQTNLHLIDSLQHRILLGAFAHELEDSLLRLTERHIVVLERVLKRARY